MDQTNPTNPATGATSAGTPPKDAAHSPPAAGAGVVPGASPDLAKELADLKAWKAEQETKAKAEADSRKTEAQRREEREAAQVDQLRNIELRGFRLDLRDAGLPPELIDLVAMPAKAEERPAAVAKAKATFEAAVRAAVTKQPPAGAAPGSPPAQGITPHVPPPPPPKDLGKGWADLSKKIRDRGLKP